MGDRKNEGSGEGSSGWVNTAVPAETRGEPTGTSPPCFQAVGSYTGRYCGSGQEDRGGHAAGNPHEPRDAHGTERRTLGPLRADGEGREYAPGGIGAGAPRTS